MDRFEVVGPRLVEPVGWQRLLVPFAWREVDRGVSVWTYWENRITGQRRASRSGVAYCPVDRDWIERLRVSYRAQCCGVATASRR